MNDPRDPHAGQPVLSLGAPLASARYALLLLHGRGASAEDILWLAGGLERPDLVVLAPQAARNTWYPERFLAPTARNQPWLASALAAVGRTLAQLEAAGIPAGRTFLAGFSQGACLALEYAARHARRYAGLAGLSGALIGGDDEPRQDQGSLSGTPVFLGCSDGDPHIPQYRFERTAQLLQAQGAQVTARLYPGLGHAVNQDELDALRALVDAA